MKKVLGCQIVRQCFKNITMDFMYITKISKSTPEFFAKKTPIASQEETAGLA